MQTDNFVLAGLSQHIEIVVLQMLRKCGSDISIKEVRVQILQKIPEDYRVVFSAQLQILSETSLSHQLICARHLPLVAGF